MVESKVYTAIGLMSGTSLDGIDVALIQTDGMDKTQLLEFKTFPYKKGMRQAVWNVFGRTQLDAEIINLEKEITEIHIQAVQDFRRLLTCPIDIMGFHGQSITHDPAQKFTWQIGDSAKLARETGIDVVGDMRQADIKAGGQGAPLLPLCHRAFASEIKKPIAVLNLGGVGNLTWLGEERTDILAFDTGPACALIDDVMQTRTGLEFDKDGALAAKGCVQEDILARWLDHDYFKKLPPKSLDRNEFSVHDIENLSVEDSVATLTAFTVQSVVQSLALLPDLPRALYVAGGGRYNKTIMGALAAALPYAVLPVEDLGWNGDGLEAQGFAYLAVRSLLGLALTLPSTTAIPEPMTGGVLYRASDNLARRPAKYK